MKYYKNQKRDKRITKMTNYPLCFKLKINETQKITGKGKERVTIRKKSIMKMARR